jgi:exodeoxyribonuclease V gamma subunit
MSERPLGLVDLVNLLKSPIDSLYQQRLLIAKPQMAGEVPSTESFALSGLQNWQLHNQVLSDHLHSQAVSEPMAAKAMHLQYQMDTWQRDGTLLTGTAGQIQAQPYMDGMVDLYEAWQQLHQSTSAPIIPVTYAAAHMVVDAQDSEQELQVAIGLANLALDQHSKRGHQILVQASHALVKADKQDKKWRNLCAAWVQHLGAHLYSQMPVDTYLLTPQGQIHLPPLSSGQADNYFTHLLQVWWLAMHEPLPLSLQLGMQLVADKPPSDAGMAAAYELDLQQSGHYLQRHFPYLVDMDRVRCAELAKLVYAPLQANVELM